MYVQATEWHTRLQELSALSELAVAPFLDDTDHENLRKSSNRLPRRALDALEGTQCGASASQSDTLVQPHNRGR